ncbi:DUF6082 family protein [Actinomadura sp. 3N508]|uniref:DUF6082 family protein n=1 Tax=Actinomadura sp. 3N508 TaxID=3375153 RepID=UPI0037B82ADA
MARWTRGLFICGAVTLIIGAIVLPPIVLSALSGLGGDWAKLSDVSQAYSLVATTTSSVALAAVAYSIYLQTRDSRASREQHAFSMQLEIIKAALGDDTLLTAGEPPHGQHTYTRDEFRREFYVNAVLKYYYMVFVTRGLSEMSVRPGLASLMRGQAARAYWRDHGDHWLAGPGESDSLMLRYRDVVAEEYEKSVALMPGVAPEDYFET